MKQLKSEGFDVLWYRVRTLQGNPPDLQEKGACTRDAAEGEPGEHHHCAEGAEISGQCRVRGKMRQKHGD
jgi:hypothetical protein